MAVSWTSWEFASSPPLGPSSRPFPLASPLCSPSCLVLPPHPTVSLSPYGHIHATFVRPLIALLSVLLFREYSFIFFSRSFTYSSLFQYQFFSSCALLFLFIIACVSIPLYSFFSFVLVWHYSVSFTSLLCFLHILQQQFIIHFLIRFSTAVAYSSPHTARLSFVLLVRRVDRGAAVSAPVTPDSSLVMAQSANSLPSRLSFPSD